MEKTLVLYVTRSGHSRALAEEVGKRLGAPVHEIVDLVSRKGFFGFMRTGAQAARGKATPIEGPKVEMAGVKTVVLVQPVWASAVCPPVRSWLRENKERLGGVRLALLASSGRPDMGRLRARWDAELGAPFGPLAASAVIPQGLVEAEKARQLDTFAAALR
jgi:hypothetical protein